LDWSGFQIKAEAPLDPDSAVDHKRKRCGGGGDDCDEEELGRETRQCLQADHQQQLKLAETFVMGLQRVPQELTLHGIQAAIRLLEELADQQLRPKQEDVIQV
jgi:hypothetical protein